MPGRFGDREAVLRCKFLDSRGDVDVIAIEPVAADDDVAGVDAGAERHPQMRRNRSVQCGDPLLEVEYRQHGFGRTAELRHDAVAGVAERPPAERAAAIDDDVATLLERSKRRFIVDPHQA